MDECLANVQGHGRREKSQIGGSDTTCIRWSKLQMGLPFIAILMIV